MTETVLQEELERLHPASFGWALWCCDRRRDEAEEVLQTSYLKILEGSAQFEGRSSLRTWLFAVIRRTAMEQRRRRSMRGRLFERWQASQSAPPSEPDPEALASKAAENRILLQTLARLSERQRAVLHLVFYQDLSIEEASVILDVSVGTARTHFERGKRQLRRLLAQPEGRS
jgi:RNA polymerase sigma-70 factor (ECF subfamily)